MRAPDRRAVLGHGAAIAALAAACLVAPALRAAAPAFDLVQLMELLAQVKAGEASFVEKRSVVMLDRTLQSSGRLSFKSPDTFVRETLKPMRERVAVVGNEVTMSLGGRSRTVPLDSAPEALILMEAIRGTLTGNRAALERHFNATVSGTAPRWTLELVPREPRLREQVISVRVSGKQAAVLEVVVAMADGDRSVMTIEPMAAVGAQPAADTATEPLGSAPSAPSARPASAPR